MKRINDNIQNQNQSLSMSILNQSMERFYKASPKTQTPMRLITRKERNEFMPDSTKNFSVSPYTPQKPLEEIPVSPITKKSGLVASPMPSPMKQGVDDERLEAHRTVNQTTENMVNKIAADEPSEEYSGESRIDTYSEVIEDEGSGDEVNDEPVATTEAIKKK